jgi:hypothetical protein
MSDLRRWSEEGASEEERRLLAAHRENPSDRARNRALVALGVGGAVAASGGTAAAGVGLTAKIGAAVAVAALVGGALAYRFSGSPPTATVAPPASASAAPVAVHEPAPSATVVEPVASAPKPAPSPVKSVVTPTPKPAASSSLAIEVKALEDAQGALNAHDPDGALRILDQYHARFPNGTLGGEETVIRVQALLARGDREKATALANAYATAHPDTPYARRIQALVKK